nr:MAG TPA: hypothetical protein [Caudoviricetes sp.]
MDYRLRSPRMRLNGVRLVVLSSVLFRVSLVVLPAWWQVRPSRIWRCKNMPPP